MTNHNIILANDVIKPNYAFSYVNDALQNYSRVDFFMVSHNLSMQIICNTVWNDRVHLSDHQAIVLIILLRIYVNCDTFVTNDHIRPIQNDQLRWNKKDLSNYYFDTQNKLPSLPSSPTTVRKEHTAQRKRF